MSGVFDRRPGVEASGDEAVAAGGDIGVAVTGAGAVGTQYTQQHIGQYIDKATILPGAGYGDAVARPEAVDAPTGLTNLPMRPGLFVGRVRELALLDAALATPGGAVVQALHGLGGIGKSTLAAHWVADRTQHCPAWWITADSPAALDSGLAGLAAALEPDLTKSLHQQQLRDWAVRWLAAHDNWLIVLDNVSDPADLKPLLAVAGNGRFLITSRRSSGWHGLAAPVALDVLTLDEALDLFTRICPDAGDEVGRLCTELGCLPLAVEQAASYCAETVTTAADYLSLLASYPADMYAAVTEGGDSDRTAARVWRVTLDRLADDPLAVRILLALAWYAPDDIPRSLLDTFGSPIAVRRALGRLAAHSMLALHGETISLHRLVQAVARTSDHTDPHRRPDAVALAREMAAEALVEGLPTDTGDPAQWPRWHALLPHVEALAEYVPAAADSVDLARVFSITGEFLSTYGMGGRAGGLLHRGEAGLLRHLGPDHRLSLIARNRLISVEKVSIEDARGHVERCTQQLGARDPETITALYEVAREYLSRDATEEARTTLEQVIRRRTKALGPGHRDTLGARAGLARMMLVEGSAQTAFTALRAVYEDCARELGPTHPLTLDLHGQVVMHMPGTDELVARAGTLLRRMDSSDEDEIRSYMADLFEQFIELSPAQMQSWAGETMTSFEDHLANCEAVLGAAHADTIHARLGVAQQCLMVGDVSRSVALLERSRADAERSLSPDHPLALTARLMSEMLALLLEGAEKGRIPSKEEFTARLFDAFDVAQDDELSEFLGLAVSVSEEIRRPAPEPKPLTEPSLDEETPDPG